LVIERERETETERDRERQRETERDRNKERQSVNERVDLGKIFLRQKFGRRAFSETG
jgi:hypothetical protein